MWSSKALSRLGFVAALALSAPLLGACTLTPVYSEANLNGQTSLQLAYAKPTSRMEQIINQELALRLGSSDSPTAPLVTVYASSSVRSLALSTTTNPAKPYQATITATATITSRDGSDAAPIQLVRVASADFTSNSQVLADTSATIEANERAAKAVAESLRLAILAALTR